MKKVIIPLVLVVSVIGTFLPNCAIQHNHQQYCYQCNPGYALSNGQCTNCIVGYSMQNGSCVQDTQNTQKSTNGTNNGTNGSTSSGNSTTNGQAQTVSTTSATTSTTSGTTSTAASVQNIPGFTVQQHPCSAINTTSNQCLNCIQGYTLSNGACVQGAHVSTGSGNSGTVPTTVSGSTGSSGTTASASTSSTGSSTSSTSSTSSGTQTIYSNIVTLTNSPSTTSTPSATSQSTSSATSQPTSTSNLDQGCAAYNSTTNLCIQCASGYHQSTTSSTFICILNDQLCASYNTNWTCKTCYLGYTLSLGTCIAQTASAATDAYCSQFTNGVCTQCYKGYYVNSATSKCVVANSQCKTVDTANNCLTCYGGYLLISGQCYPASHATSTSQISLGSNGHTTITTSTGTNIFYSFPIPYIVGNNNAYSDPLCKDFVNGVCVTCSYRAYFKNGVCMQVDASCQSWNNSTGQCYQCYQGYTVSSNGISCSSTQSTLVSSSGSCPHRSIPINGICQPVSDQCKTWDNQAKCTSCYLGYTNNNGVCQ